MAARQIVIGGAFPSRDANGRAMAGKLRFYLDGTSTPATVYEDEALTIPHDFPILSDSAGRWPDVWAEETDTFNVVWSDLANDAQVRAFSGVQALYDYLTASADAASASEDAAAASAAAALVSELAAAASAAAAQEPGFTTTSASTITIPTTVPTTVSFTLAADVFAAGQTLKFALQSDPTKNFTGDVATYTAGVGTLSALMFNGAGSGSAWIVSVAASVDSSLSARVTTLEAPATAAQIRAGTNNAKYATAAALSGAAAWITLTDAATVAWDASLGFNAKITQTAARTIGAPTNLIDGITYSLLLDCGGFTPTGWASIWDFGEAGTPIPTTTSGKKHLITAIYDAAQTKLLASYRPPA